MLFISRFGTHEAATTTKLPETRRIDGLLFTLGQTFGGETQGAATGTTIQQKRLLNTIY